MKTITKCVLVVVDSITGRMNTLRSRKRHHRNQKEAGPTIKMTTTLALINERSRK